MPIGKLCEDAGLIRGRSVGSYLLGPCLVEGNFPEVRGRSKEGLDGGTITLDYLILVH
jgi:hypothetical protein